VSFDVDGEQPFSASSVNTFLRCAKQWEYAYVYEFKRPPSVRSIIGISAHSAEETNYAQKIESKADLPLNDVLDVFSTSFDSQAPEAEPDKEETVGQAKDSGIKTLSVYHESVAPGIQPLWVEHEGLMMVNDIPYGYSIDLVDDKERVRDYKYTRKRPSEGSRDYKLNMIGYAMAYRNETGRKEADVVLDYMVRTQKPYHWPVASSGPVSDNAISNFASILELVRHAVSEGTFLPTGLQGHACGWCGYRDICDAYNA
jgi:CRISPR/Cas system-associated exonuclease Cas4 (RecB family)